MSVANPDLVSVIIPTHNRVDLLLQALESVRRQTWPHVEIIVVDDGSTDETAAQVKAMPNVCYVRQERRGQATARNLGLTQAHGAFVCSLDSDDLWAPDFLESGIQALRTLQADFVFANWVGENRDGTRFLSYLEKLFEWSHFHDTALEDWKLLDPQQTRDIYIEACLSPSSALIFRRELIAGWLETLRIGDDWCLLLDIVLNKPCRVGLCTRRLWVKRVNGDNICDQRDFMEVKRDLYIHDYHLMLKRFFAVLTPPERALIYGRLAANYHRLAKGEWSRRRIPAIPGLCCHSALCFLQAVRYAPEIVQKRLRRINPHRRAVAAPELNADSAATPDHSPATSEAVLADRP